MWCGVLWCSVVWCGVVWWCHLSHHLYCLSRTHVPHRRGIICITYRIYLCHIGESSDDPLNPEVVRGLRQFDAKLKLQQHALTLMVDLLSDEEHKERYSHFSLSLSSWSLSLFLVFLSLFSLFSLSFLSCSLSLVSDSSMIFMSVWVCVLVFVVLTLLHSTPLHSTLFVCVISSAGTCSHLRQHGYQWR